ncbi:MAG: topoisomerase DNA-binding C4 zinc finger domain-containing protein, partial [Methanomassiliicoccaceae archaeon]|nr:topoisomerase DNA-binding C4 zinc finger domain-containing protein [Methanomassiliicoccaceae archaeon]
KSDIGECPSCGGRIRIMYSKAGRRFAGCSGWPQCDRTYPLRPTGTITPTDDKCEHCSSPIISVGNRTECISMECPGKGDAVKKKSPAKK